MPIFSPKQLEALPILKKEGVVFSPEKFNGKQSLSIAILNLMPIKLDAELQLIRFMAKTRLNINVYFFRTATYQSKNANPDYLRQNYYVFDEIKEQKIDAFIITGAPVALKNSTEIQYWQEYVNIAKDIRNQKLPSYFICWSGIAILEHFYAVKKVILPQKLVGLYPHAYQTSSKLLNNIESPIAFPVSRYTGPDWVDVCKNPDLNCCLCSDKTSAALLEDTKLNWVFALSHPEYEEDRLAKEYFRDKEKGLNPSLPFNYFPDDNPQNIPKNTWEKQGIQLFKNWFDMVLTGKTEKIA